jgi:hypothetical protein
MRQVMNMKILVAGASGKLFNITKKHLVGIGKPICLKWVTKLLIFFL